MSTRTDFPEESSASDPHSTPGHDPFAGSKHWIYGFLLLGVLLGLVGSLFIAWQYHVGADPTLVGLHFLSLNAGFVFALSTVRRPLRRLSLRTIALTGCALACASLLVLAFLAPPVLPVWRMAGLSLLGFSAGLITAALLHILEDCFIGAPVYAMNLTGTLFGCGCTLVTVAIATTYFAGSVQLELSVLALVPAFFFLLFLRSRFPQACAPAVRRDREKRWQSVRDLRSIAAALFSLLLFFQFGNEWVIGGWLALFLIQRLGANPVEAVFSLAIYFLALTAGRLLVRILLPRLNHRKLLYASILISMAGYVMLTFAPSTLIASIGASVIALGYAPIYPIIAETLDQRFSFHPGFYQRIFSIAMTGAMSAPWLVGYLNNWLGIQSVMLIPAFGTLAVLILVLLIRLEARLMKSNDPEENNMSMANHG